MLFLQQETFQNILEGKCEQMQSPEVTNRQLNTQERIPIGANHSDVNHIILQAWRWHHSISSIL